MENEKLNFAETALKHIGQPGPLSSLKRLLVISPYDAKLFAADPPRSTGWIPRVISLTRSEAPTLAEWSGSLATAHPSGPILPKF